MSKIFQHCINPLHVYCRLRDVGIPKDYAVPLCRFYENTIFMFLRRKVRMVF